MHSLKLHRLLELQEQIENKIDQDNHITNLILET